jgi:hypothetical protein
MEEVIELEPLEFPYVPLIYVALFNPDTGEIVSIGPESAFEHETNKIVIDSEIAERVIEGKVRIQNCFVDLTTGTFEIAELKNVYKIDDVLHRIVDKKWSDIEKPDLFVTYNKKKKTLTFELTEELGGSKKLPKKHQPAKKRKVIWEGSLEMSFLITDYNDPNVLYKMLSFKISDLSESPMIYEGVDVPTKFSVYTRRLFKNYVMEIK